MDATQTHFAMKRLFAPVLLLLALTRALDAKVQGIDSTRLQDTNVDLIEMENAEDSIGELVAGSHMMRRQKEKEKQKKKKELETTKDQTKADKQQLKQNIKELKDDIRELEKEYDFMKETLEAELEAMLENLDSEPVTNIDGSVCKTYWTWSAESNVNCVGGNFCHDSDTDVCKISCNEPGSPLACDPSDTKCCEVCPCCDGCYNTTKPDKCLGEDLTHCVCDPISCCATHSCDSSGGAEEAADEAKDKAKNKKEKNKQQKNNKNDIDQVKQMIEVLKTTIGEKNEELKSQIEQLQLVMAADIIEDNTSPEGECKDNWTNTTGNNVNCIGGNLCYASDKCELDCFEPAPLACDPSDTKCCEHCPCCQNCKDEGTNKCAETEIMYCFCDPPECCATFSCDQMWSHSSSLRGSFGDWW